ncbi:alpha/beta fold hydrolase [Pseudalkalibacillus sp. A8]|uniref:alpha/beta fold hydrolase n=1 Tax=Pseudalkalibacillus sp. A8 TaxID=3382641 RepID=UPI0038B4BF90
MFFKDWGNGKPIVFISSWAISSRMWEYQMVELYNEGLRCIAYDRKGNGRSDGPGKGYDYDTLAVMISML